MGYLNREYTDIVRPTDLIRNQIEAANETLS